MANWEGFGTIAPYPKSPKKGPDLRRHLPRTSRWVRDRATSEALMARIEGIELVIDWSVVCQNHGQLDRNWDDRPRSLIDEEEA